ncbi:MAG: PD-(D/E)XK nuclease domain-containing protein [Chitinispirillales bacterium]|nr:PD-(D/E)XK nuclease domain-containing protein [Chitinispirillales bacterium]
MEREYAAGRGRMDLAVEYNNKTYIIEIKLIRSYNTRAETKKKPWDERISWETEGEIAVLRC